MEHIDEEKLVDTQVEPKAPVNDLRDDDSIPLPQYITGWRLHAISLGLLTGIFVAQMESSVTSTAVLAITNDLGGYEKSSWLFTAYWLTYCGFQMVWAKLSDITGRKPAIIVSLSIFTIFSGACGGSQTLDQLIMFRWVQGMGGCGVFALSQLIFFELVPPAKWPAYISLVTAIIALSLMVGPLIGGGIASHGQWRWIFLFNVPLGFVAVLGLIRCFPARLWNEPAARDQNASYADIFSWRALRRVDLAGSLLLLGSCILSSTGLQQAAIGYSWTSPFVLPLLLCTAVFAVGFFVWQWYVTTRRTYPEPVFPWRFCQSRIRLGMILNTYLVGSVMTICVVQIPQRFMTVNGLSPFAAGVKLLPFAAFVPTGSSIAAGLMGKPKVPPCWIILAGIIMQIIGTAFLSQASTSSKIEASQYGFQILAGAGAGFINAALILLVPYAMEKRDLAVGTSAISQFRILGGLMGLAIATSITTPYIRKHLLSTLSPELAYALLEKPSESMRLVPSEALGAVQEIFGKGYNLQMILLAGLAGAQFPALALMWTNQIASPGEK